MRGLERSWECLNYLSLLMWNSKEKGVNIYWKKSEQDKILKQMRFIRKGSSESNG